MAGALSRALLSAAAAPQRRRCVSSNRSQERAVRGWQHGDLKEVRDGWAMRTSQKGHRTIKPGVRHVNACVSHRARLGGSVCPDSPYGAAVVRRMGMDRPTSKGVVAYQEVLQHLVQWVSQLSSSKRHRADERPR